MSLGAPSSALRAWALALLVSLVLWNLPFGGLLLYPFKLLATWLHELSHAAVMELTGVGFRRMVVHPDSSGLAYAASVAGPVARPLIAAAGYMGTPLVGGLLLVLTTSPTRARALLLAMGAALAFTAVWILDNAFGRQAIGAIAAGFLLLGALAPASLRVGVMQFVAAQACVHALLDIRVLFRAKQVVGGKEAMSDAHTMAASTLGSTEPWAVWLWAGLWLAWSLAVCFFAVQVASRTHGARPGQWIAGEELRSSSRSAQGSASR
ncbi:MAG: M50 family metallopeptidase [Kofleriaceae bacterium]